MHATFMKFPFSQCQYFTCFKFDLNYIMSVLMDIPSLKLSSLQVLFWYHWFPNFSNANSSQAWPYSLQMTAELATAI